MQTPQSILKGMQIFDCVDSNLCILIQKGAFAPQLTKLIMDKIPNHYFQYFNL